MTVYFYGFKYRTIGVDLEQSCEGENIINFFSVIDIFYIKCKSTIETTINYY